MLKIYRTFLILNRSPIYRKLLAVIQLLKSLFEREDCIASVPVWKIKILSYYIDRIAYVEKISNYSTWTFIFCIGMVVESTILCQYSFGYYLTMKIIEVRRQLFMCLFKGDFGIIVAPIFEHVTAITVDQNIILQLESVH